MPETTRPVRKRAKAAAATKAAPVKSVAATPAAAAETGEQRTTVALEPAGETKTYAKFSPPDGSGCVGTFYAPLGTTDVRVLLIAPAAAE
jgi:hypothetical protein